MGLERQLEKIVHRCQDGERAAFEDALCGFIELDFLECEELFKRLGA